MMPSVVSLLLDAAMAVLMTALIVYCVKLNRRLSLLRDQDSEIKELIAGFREASERADQSVQRLKAAGLAAERSLRGAIEDAAAARAELTRLSSGVSAARTEPPREKAPAAGPMSAPPGAREARAKRDMLMGGAPAERPAAATPPASPAPIAPVRPRTREEAEESVIQAIRLARGEA